MKKEEEEEDDEESKMSSINMNHQNEEMVRALVVI